MTMTEQRPIYKIAEEIREVWTPRVHPFAAPYVDAMLCLDKITDPYLAESGCTIVRYFLSNARSWRGEDARRIKAELKALIK